MSGDEYLIAEWETQPYTSHDRRGDVVEKRLLLIVYDHGADVMLEWRGEGRGSFTTEKVWELRNGRVTTTERNGVFSS